MLYIRCLLMLIIFPDSSSMDMTYWLQGFASWSLHKFHQFYRRDRPLQLIVLVFTNYPFALILLEQYICTNQQFIKMVISSLKVFDHYSSLYGGLKTDRQAFNQQLLAQLTTFMLIHYSIVDLTAEEQCLAEAKRILDKLKKLFESLHECIKTTVFLLAITPLHKYSVQDRQCFAVIMNKSELFDSSIAEEERIIGINLQQQPKEQPRYKLRFATIAEIKNYQRLANIRNLKLVETCPAFFNQGDVQPKQRHFVAKNNEQYFLNGVNKEETSDVIAKREKRWEVLIDTSNIQQQSILKIELSNFKRIRTFALETRQVQGSKAIGYRYTFNKVENSLVVRVWLELDGAFKVWKEMELPVSQSNITIEIHQVNNEQTDVRINDYLFHLLLKMPYYRQAHFWLIHEDAAEIQTVQVKTVRQQKYYEDTQTNCSNECQLI